jgi:hypothetical protein
MDSSALAGQGIGRAGDDGHGVLLSLGALNPGECIDLFNGERMSSGIGPD